MTLLRSLVGAAAMALSATVAAAQTTVTYLGGTTAESDGYHLIGPFNGTLQTLPGSAQSITMFCIDVLNDVSIGDSWTGVLTSLADPAATLSTTRHAAASDPTAMTKYRTTAWLTTQFGLHSSESWADIQHAIWNVWAPGQYAANAWDAAGASAAASGFAGFDFSNYWVLTDVTGVGQALGGAQEFIVPGIGGGGTGSVVPEPSTYLLMATGMVALAGVARRRRQSVRTR
ncbi:PEP-CTERM sorting domain-containing protein [Roseisolibacter agri]|uniref:Ice-binding protein C-terminal domain-containing protein n=1 Tax=Roseisolibacter agri TaxID=2014610 RepID=A0AA37Q2D3_9BACT|nr:PEP-CTERM sorting domain-containing protein [Roseisolibacter agri]GLC25325.1 hypothetical protein rosag_18380 [Roseisolibacter agri]